MQLYKPNLKEYGSQSYLTFAVGVFRSKQRLAVSVRVVYVRPVGIGIQISHATSQCGKCLQLQVALVGHHLPCLSIHLSHEG